eukprot:1045628-Pelagomonas_calceolata.AAC.3
MVQTPGQLHKCDLWQAHSLHTGSPAHTGHPHAQIATHGELATNSFQCPKYVPVPSKPGGPTSSEQAAAAAAAATATR